MEKPNETTTTSGYYYVYNPGYLEKKCIKKLCEVVQEYQITMDVDAELCDLKKQIEDLNTKYNNYHHNNGGVNDAC